MESGAFLFFSSINRIAGCDGLDCMFNLFILLELRDKGLDMRVCWGF